MIEISLYLQRIRYNGSLDPTPATLRALQLAHLQAVPFENLDIHLGRKIELDTDAFFDKIVVHRRGGFCYELNGLFSALLSQLGFAVTQLSARVAHADGGYGHEFDHLTLAIQCPGDTANHWLADVGFGDSFYFPLDLAERGEQHQGLRAYRIDCDNDSLLLWQRDYKGVWEKQYRFTLQPRQLEDFSQMCAYHQTSPLSSFTRNRICTLATPEGRVTVEPTRLITTVSGERTEQPVEGEEDFRRILGERFGIKI